MCDRPDHPADLAEPLPGLVRSAQITVEAALAATKLGEDADDHLMAAHYLLQRAVGLLDDCPTPESVATESGRDLPVDLEAAHTEIQGLRRAMLTRSVIEQAKGMLMLRLGVNEYQAFMTLSRLSQRTHVKVAELSHLLVAKGIAEHGQRSRRKSPAEGC